jgi:glycosyltransferase involved in cell wall biosynthesis
LSRIVKSKNLLFILQIIKKFKIKLIFDIYGPIEDLKYWKKCQNEFFSMPNNILINYKGIAYSNKVQSIFFKYDLFCFPSISENFGNVIYESLSSGTPVLCHNNLNHLKNIKSNYSNIFFLKKNKNIKEWNNEILKFYKLSIKERIIVKKKIN